MTLWRSPKCVCDARRLTNKHQLDWDVCGNGVQERAGQGHVQHAGLVHQDGQLATGSLQGPLCIEGKEPLQVIASLHNTQGPFGILSLWEMEMSRVTPPSFQAPR